MPRKALYSRGSDDDAKRGIGSDALDEMVPAFAGRTSDKEIKGTNNTWIILGRDRPGDHLSGYGGKGVHAAGAIDIVVGRMAPIPIDKYPTANSKESPIIGDPVELDPLFNTLEAKELEGFRLPSVGVYHPAVIMDAARIYISQTCDIDQEMALAPGMGDDEDQWPLPKLENPRSAIAMKADGVRIIAREGIKLITGGAKYETINSQGGAIGKTHGIDLIAGNGFPDRGMSIRIGQQPLVKGDSLIAAIDELAMALDQFASLSIKAWADQMVFNGLVTSHTHPEIVLLGAMGVFDPKMAFVGGPLDVFKKILSIQNLLAFKFNTGVFYNNYLAHGAPDWICSRYNSTN